MKHFVSCFSPVPHKLTSFLSCPSFPPVSKIERSVRRTTPRTIPSNTDMDFRMLRVCTLKLYEICWFCYNRSWYWICCFFYSTYLRYFLMVEVAIVVTGKERSEGYNKKLKSSERVGNRCISNQTRISEFWSRDGHIFYPLRYNFFPHPTQNRTVCLLFFASITAVILQDRQVLQFCPHWSQGLTI